MNIREGDEITVEHDVINISGSTIIEKGQKVTVRKLYKRDAFTGHRSRTEYPEKLIGVAIEGHYGGIFLPQVFTETKNL